MRIILHGRIKRLYGETFNLEVNSPAEAVRALSCQIKDFAKTIRDGNWHVFSDRRSISENELELNLTNEIHIMPAVLGAKNNGVLKIIVGVALMGISFGIGGGFSAAVHGFNQGVSMLGLGTTGLFFRLGAGLVLMGLGQALSPSPTKSVSAEKRPSYLFGSPQNVATEGNIIPTCYGEAWCGSVVLSSGNSVRLV